MVRRLIKKFPEFEIKQKEDNYCGPASLQYCLALMGIKASEWDCAYAGGLTSIVGEYISEHIGTLPKMIIRAARSFGAWGEMVPYQEEEGRLFVKDLKDHLEEGCGAVVLVDSGHWIAVVGYDKKAKKFIVNDPANEDLILEKVNHSELLEWAFSGDEALEIEGYLAVYIGNYELEEVH